MGNPVKYKHPGLAWTSSTSTRERVCESVRKNEVKTERESVCV